VLQKVKPDLHYWTLAAFRLLFWERTTLSQAAAILKTEWDEMSPKEKERYGLPPKRGVIHRRSRDPQRVAIWKQWLEERRKEKEEKQKGEAFELLASGRGTVADVARHLGINHQSVRKWLASPVMLAQLESARNISTMATSLRVSESIPDVIGSLMGIINRPTASDPKMALRQDDIKIKAARAMSELLRASAPQASAPQVQVNTQVNTGEAETAKKESHISGLLEQIAEAQKDGTTTQDLNLVR